MVNILKIAVIVASEEHVSYNPFVVDEITPEILAKFNIPEEADPFEEGQRSAVYVNNDGDIVSFSSDSHVAEVAKRLKGVGQTALPEVYDVEEFETGGFFDTIFGVRMEQLQRPLNKVESYLYERYRWEIVKGIPMKYTIDRTYEVLSKKPRFKEFERAFKKKMQDLADRADQFGITQEDLRPGNVMWDDNGRLRFIDLESINLNDVGLDNQPYSIEFAA